MEHLTAKDGSITFGWVRPSVFFSKFVGELSEALGAWHNQALERAIESSTSVHYFVDSSGLTAYDLRVRRSFVRLVLDHRRRFSEFVILSWAAGTSEPQALLAPVGEPLIVLDERADFVRRLAQAALRASNSTSEGRLVVVPDLDAAPKLRSAR
jgi:hypothetical protein